MFLARLTPGGPGCKRHGSGQALQARVDRIATHGRVVSAGGTVGAVGLDTSVGARVARRRLARGLPHLMEPTLQIERNLMSMDGVRHGAYGIPKETKKHKHSY